MAGITTLAELIGRILISIMFLLSGLNKIGGYAGTQAYMESMGVPGMLLPLAIIVEVVGAIAVIVGWFTRWFALALAGFCILAALLFHSNFDDRMQIIMFMKNIAIAGGFLVIFAYGAGKLSLDNKLGKA